MGSSPTTILSKKITPLVSDAFKFGYVSNRYGVCLNCGIYLVCQNDILCNQVNGIALDVGCFGKKITPLVSDASVYVNNLLGGIVIC